MRLFETDQYGQESVHLLRVGQNIVEEENSSFPRMNMYIEKYHSEMWQQCDSISEWILQTFPIVEVTREFESYPFISSEQNKINVEINRASSLIAKCTRRGRGNTLYLSANDRKEIPRRVKEYDIHLVENIIPPKHILILYEGSNSVDRGFLYEETRGIIQTEQTPLYGRILKIVE